MRKGKVSFWQRCNSGNVFLKYFYLLKRVFVAKYSHAEWCISLQEAHFNASCEACYYFLAESFHPSVQLAARAAGEMRWSAWCTYAAKYYIIGLRTDYSKELVTLLSFHSLSEPPSCLSSHRSVYFICTDLYFPVYSLVDKSVLCLLCPSWQFCWNPQNSFQPMPLTEILINFSTDF